MAQLENVDDSIKSHDHRIWKCWKVWYGFSDQVGPRGDVLVVLKC